MFPQELLRREAQRRVDSAGRFGHVSSGFGAVAVIARFDPAVFASSARHFAAGVPTDVATHWRAAFTRTVFLAGQPANLTTRFPPYHLSADGTVAWYGPADSHTTTTLRRLLRPLSGPHGVPMPYEADIALYGDGAAVLAVVVSGVAVEQYLSTSTTSSPRQSQPAAVLRGTVGCEQNSSATNATLVTLDAPNATLGA